MNEPRKTDFFPEIDERDAHKLAPDTYKPYQDTEEDLLHEQRLREIRARLDEKFGAASSADDDLGELPYDAEADRKRWIELEKDFDRVFREAEDLENQIKSKRR
jgi:hypothetical protein